MDRFEQIINIRRALFRNEVPVAKGDKPVDVQEAENIKKNGNSQATIDFADYPWEVCIEDQIKAYGDKATAEAVCGSIKAMYGSKEEMDITPNPCWEGYEPIGLKEDGSPNCVPIKEEQKKEKFVIPSPLANEEEDVYIGRCISAIIDEYGQEQATAICYSQWEQK
jgi:hypothetical protein